MAAPRIRILTEEQKARKYETTRRWHTANPEKLRKNNAKWRAANHEHAKEHSTKSSARWRANNPELAKERSRKSCARHRAANLESRREADKKLAAKRRATTGYSRKVTLKRHGLTVTEYDAMVIAQNNRCAICGTDKPGRTRARYWYVDHCHKTKVVRKLLCHGCNLGIGHFKDDPALLQCAIDYLNDFS